jgi:hypothetical protein
MRVSLMILLGTLGLALLLFGAAAWRLQQGPVEARFLTDALERVLTEERGGKPVRIEAFEIISKAGSVRLRARGVRALSARGVRPAQSAELDLAFSGAALLRGRVALTRATVSGGDVTLALRRDGSTAFSFGPPGTEPDFVLPAGKDSETWRQKVLRGLDGLEALFNKGGAGAYLKRFGVSGANLYVLDERSDAVWQAQDAALGFDRTGAVITASASATLRRDAATAAFSLALKTDPGFQAAHVEMLAQDALLRSIVGAGSALDALQAPLDVQVSTDVDRTAGVRAFKLRAKAGAGALRVGPDLLALSGADLVGEYSLETDVLALESLEISGAGVSVQGSGRIRDVAELISGRSGDRFAFDFAMPKLRIASSAFEQPLTFADVEFNGEMDARGRAITFSKFVAKLNAARVELAGKLFWATDAQGKTSPGFQAHGSLDGDLNPATVLQFWPNALQPDSRRWFTESMLSARISKADLDFDLTPKDFAGGPLRRDVLKISIPVVDATVLCVEGMAPLRKAVGVTILQGDSLLVLVDSGELGGLAISKGSVFIPSFSETAQVTVKAHAEGAARNIVALILQTPLDIQDRIPVDPATIVGDGGMDLTIVRPLAPNATAEQVHFKVDGGFRGVGGLLKQGGQRLSNWDLKVLGDDTNLRFQGPLSFGGSRAALDWREVFVGQDAGKSLYTLDGRLLVKDLDLLGISAREFAQGAAQVSLRGIGQGINLESAQLTLDLRETELALPQGIWSKRAGVAANAKLRLKRSDRGDLTLEDGSLDGPGLQARGRGAFAASGRLLSLDIPSLKLSGRYDTAIKGWRDAADTLVLDANGPLFDATPFLIDLAKQSTQPRASASPPLPAAVPIAQERPEQAGFELRLQAGDLLLREGVIWHDADLRFVSLVAGLDRFSFQAKNDEGGIFAGSMAPAESPALRRLDFRADNLADALKGLLGTTPIRQGRGLATGQWDPAGGTGRLTLSAQNFQVADVPLAARVLSSVASLQGFANLVSGEGIAFDRLDASLKFSTDEIVVGSAKARGPSIGVTSEGRIGLRDQVLGLSGVLVPAYTLNSVLGEVPGLGRLLTSRKGEGIFAFTYSMRGPTDRVRVSVNPASGLAPGIFRRLFEPSAPVPKSVRRAAIASASKS